MTKQEPVGYLSEGGAERLVIKKQAHEQIRNFRLFAYDVPLYTTPQRTWVELTDEEIEELANEYLFAEEDLEMLFVGGSVEFARALLKKAREK